MKYTHSTAPDPLRGRPPPHISAIAPNPSGTYAVSARTDKLLRLWRVSPTLADSASIEAPHARPVCCVAWSRAHEHVFCTVAHDQYIKVWRKTAPERDVIWPGARCFFASFGPAGSLAVLSDKAVQFYRDFESEHVWEVSVDVFHWLNAGQFFLALAKGNLLLYKLENGVRRVATLTESAASVTSIAVDPNGEYVAAGFENGLVAFWTNTLVHHKAYLHDNDAVVGLSPNHDGSLIAIALENKDTVILNYESMEATPLKNTASERPWARWFDRDPYLVYLADKGTSVCMAIPEGQATRPVSRRRDRVR